jgi:hypothetical protein
LSAALLRQFRIEYLVAGLDLSVPEELVVLGFAVPDEREFLLLVGRGLRQAASRFSS